MLTQKENELLTRTGPGTPMGETLRRYWLPALLTHELPEPDCPPVRVKLLGEELIAFRDTEGCIGLLDEYCPHRRASLWLGRNEESGLRCVYHGWKFDVAGNCLDQMNEPPENQFTAKVQIKSYPTVEQGGIAWAYLGPAEKLPPPPSFEWTRAAESHRHVSKVWEECNWLQALEGGIDTSHAPILHRRLTANTTRPGIAANAAFVRSSAPTLEVDVTDYGYRYFGVRKADSGGIYVRGYHYVMPFTQLRPEQMKLENGEMATLVHGHMWVPIDDLNCMVWNWTYSYGSRELSEDERLERNLGNGPEKVDANFRSIANRRNNWQIDRLVQKHETFTGIDGINVQDRAVQEGMGAIVDRSLEHLGPADRAIITARQLLFRAIHTVEEGGAPPGADDSYYGVRAREMLLTDTTDWRSRLLPAMDSRQAVGV